MPDAFRVIAPPAVMLRAVVALTVWFAIVSASPTPTAAVDPPATTAPAVDDALGVLRRGAGERAGRATSCRPCRHAPWS